jgi:hypothetical protein
MKMLQECQGFREGNPLRGEPRASAQTVGESRGVIEGAACPVLVVGEGQGL